MVGTGIAHLMLSNLATARRSCNRLVSARCSFCCVAVLLVAAGWLTPLRAFSSGGGCGASLVVFASAVAMQGRLLGVCMSHNQSIAVTSLCNKSC